MGTQHARRFSRRRFLGGLTVAGMGGFLGLTPRRVAAEPPPETTRLRVLQAPSGLCEAPVQVAEELLRGEGFSDVQYVRVPATANLQKIAAGEIDLGLQAIPYAVRRIEAGDPVVFLAGVHVGCFELFGHERVRTIRDLKGKVVVVSTLGGNTHTLTASMAAYVGLDPQQDITWVAQSGRKAMQFFIDGKADAFMGVPPQPALEVLKEMLYGQWREYDPEDTVRFYALRLHEAGMIKSSPQNIIAQGTDWRFLNELKKEMKG